MRLRLDTSQVRFMVSKAPEPKIDGITGMPKTDRLTNQPLSVTELIAREPDEGAEVIKVTTVGHPPKINEDQYVYVRGLIALPWSQNGRSGVAFRADSIEPVTSGTKAA